MAKVLKDAAALSGQQIVYKGVSGRKKGFGVAANAGKSVTNGSAVTITQAMDDAGIPETLVVEEQDAVPEDAPTPSATEIDQLIQAAIAPVLAALAEKDSAIAKQSADQQAAEAAQKEALHQVRAAEEKAIALAVELEQAKNDLSVAKKAQNAMDELGKLVGGSISPQRMEVQGPGSPAFRGYERLLNNAPRQLVTHNDMPIVQRDLRAANEYLNAHRDEIRGGVEAVLRDAGFLQGIGATVTNAPTVMSDIPSAAFSYLADYVRRPSDADLIYRQFARMHPVPGVAPNFQGQVPRYPYALGPTTTADRTLTPGTDIPSDRQAVTEKLVPVTIEELGLGKNSANAAIAITRFVQAFSIKNLEEVVMENLGRDYDRTVDLFIRTVLMSATTVVYNNANRLVDLPASVATGGIGTLTRGFLRALWAKMKTDRIPTFSGGMYAFSAPPNQIQYLQSELASIQRFVEPTSSQIEMISRILSVDEQEAFGGRVNGLKMIQDGFMIFEQNAHSIGAAGQPGVQTETLGAGSRITEECLAFGRDAVCWATALPVEIIEDEVTNFRRRRSFIWYSHENAAALDVNANAGTGQEARVIKCRLSRDPV